MVSSQAGPPHPGYLPAAIRTPLSIVHLKESRISQPSKLTQKVPAEAELLDRVRGGEESAMAELYDRYAPVVYSAALRVLGEPAAAEDVLQDVFVRLWRNPEAFDATRGSLAAWLAVIARHRAIDQMRKRRPEADFDEVVLSVDPDLDGLAERAEAIEQVRVVLGGMASEQRKALEMAFFEGMTHVEIAARTGEPLGTVKTRIRNALIMVRKALAR
jgi:RNA polymerase sigma-70 factor, ECF subfamily